MFPLPGAPPGDYGGSGLLWCGSSGELSHRIRVALQHDQPGCARRMCRREQSPGPERAGHCDQDSFTTPQIIQLRGDAVGP